VSGADPLGRSGAGSRYTEPVAIRILHHAASIVDKLAGAAILRLVNVHAPARHLLRAKDLIDARYREPLDVPALARAAHLSQAHFSREFRRAFGETPHQYLLTRRLERAAELLRNTDHSVADVCLAVGLSSVGSFTTSFGRAFGLSPTAYRAAQPPASSRARIPTCVLQAYARPRSSRFREDMPAPSG
jgi:AraC-like DNA-binding protein